MPVALALSAALRRWAPRGVIVLKLVRPVLQRGAVYHRDPAPLELQPVLALKLLLVAAKQIDPTAA
jgi:hypothetical protein